MTARETAKLLSVKADIELRIAVLEDKKRKMENNGYYYAQLDVIKASIKAYKDCLAMLFKTKE